MTAEPLTEQVTLWPGEDADELIARAKHEHQPVANAGPMCSDCQLRLEATA